MTNFPMVFGATSKQIRSGIDAQWISHRSPMASESIKISIPPEFGGPGSGFSPEDLYAMALGNCFAATFQVYAKNSRLSFSHLDIESAITIDLNEKKLPYIRQISINARLHGVDNKDRAKKLLHKVSQNCILINSVQADKAFQLQAVHIDASEDC